VWKCIPLKTPLKTDSPLSRMRRHYYTKNMAEKICNIQFPEYGFYFFLICGKKCKVFLKNQIMLSMFQCTKWESFGHSYNDTFQCIVTHVSNDTVIPSESEQCSITDQGIQNSLDDRVMRNGFSRLNVDSSFKYPQSQYTVTYKNETL
jgi:hypothetical protein